MTTNPEKLHVIVGSFCGPRAFVSADEATWDRERLGRDSSEWVTKPQAYVREDVAEAAVQDERDQKLADVQEAFAVARVNMLNTLADALESYGISDAFIERFMDEANVVDLVYPGESNEETTALRRERDALRLVVDAVAAFTAHDFAMKGPRGVMRLVQLAKDAKAAGAGVG